MAMTERQIMDKVYAEGERIGREIEKSRSTIDDLCDGQIGTFTRHAHSVFTRSVRGKLGKKEAEPTPIRHAGAASA